MADPLTIVDSQPLSVAPAGGGLKIVDSEPLPSRSWLDEAADYAKGLGSATADAAKGVWKAVSAPTDTVVGMVKDAPAQNEAIARKAEASFKAGNYAEGMRHALGYVLNAVPGLGAKIDELGDQAGSGQPGAFSNAMGQATSIGLQSAAPELLRNVHLPVAPRVVNANPVEGAALDYLERDGVPVSAAAKTGNAYVKNVQKAVDSTPLGAVVTHNVPAETANALQSTAERLANRANPAPIVPEQAGSGTRAALNAKIAAHAQDADTAYADYRNIESQPANIKTVQTGTKTVPSQIVDPRTGVLKTVNQSVPVTEDIALPADVTDIKAQLKPLAGQIEKWWQPAKRDVSEGYQAIKSILNGPDVVPASQAEKGLGGLKQLARDGDPQNAGMAKFVIPKLQSVIDGAVSAGGQDAIDALRAGRTATAAKYGAKAVLDQLRDEPVQTFGQLTYAKDSGVDLLREVAKQVPGQLPKIGRAYLEDLFGKAQSQGGWTGADGLFTKWQNLGPQTKQLIFGNPQLVSDLDKFFLGAKKLAENPNPSGTMVMGLSAGSGTLMFTNPATGIPLAIGAGALSKMLHSPAGVRALTNGLKLPLKAPAAAMTAGQIMNMAGSDVQPATTLQPNQPGN